MSAVSTQQQTTATLKEERFRYANLGPVIFGLLVATGIGALILVASLFVPGWGAQQFLVSWLFAFMFFFTISAGSMFWILIHYTMDAEWSAVIKRLLETAANSFSVLPFLFIPMLVGAPLLYKWMVIPVGAEPSLDNKHILLNPTAWAVFTTIYFSFFFSAALILRWLSLKQDHSNDLGYSTKARGVSFASIPFFGVLLTFASIHWVMSISYHWYSTMWCVYVFAGSAWSSMAVLIIVSFLLQRAGYLQGIISTQHFHIMGKLLLSFTVFWAYIAFSQYFLIWYANIPEETEFFVVRNTEGWNLWAILLEVTCHFFVTFALLCPRAAKTNPKRLALIAGWVLLMHAADWYFIVNPFVHEKGVRPLTMIVDLAALVTIGCPLVLVFLRTLGRHPLLARHDARLPESLRLVN